MALATFLKLLRQGIGFPPRVASGGAACNSGSDGKNRFLAYLIDLGDVAFNASYSADTNGWVQISPYGNFPHEYGIQKVTKEDAERMVAAFNSITNLAKKARGLPFYVGHPDADKRQWNDDKSYGRIKELEAREDGLYGRVVWNAEGKSLIEQDYYDSHSPCWKFNPDPRQKGVIRPYVLQSVGFTNWANINVSPIIAANEETEMNEYLKKLAKLMGLDEAAVNEASVEAQIGKAMLALNAAPGLATKLTEAEGKVVTLTTDLTAANGKVTKAEADVVAANASNATLTKERDEAKKVEGIATNALKAERIERTKLVLDTAINTATLTQAEKPAVEKELNEAADIAAYNTIATRVFSKASKFFTKSAAQSRTATNGKQDTADDEKWGKMRDACNALMKEKGISYNAAWNSLKMSKEFAGLFTGQSA